MCNVYTEDVTCARLPVVEILPNVLRNNHNQVVYVVVFIWRNPCTKTKCVKRGIYRLIIIIL